jgi:hypothetical protein
MWKLGTEAAQFPEKEYINGIYVAVWAKPVTVFYISFIELYKIKIVSICRTSSWRCVR